MFKNRGIHFIHSLLPKIEERHHFTQLTNTYVTGISETKLDESVLNSEIVIQEYEFIRLARSRKGDNVAYFIRHVVFGRGA